MREKGEEFKKAAHDRSVPKKDTGSRKGSVQYRLRKSDLPSIQNLYWAGATRCIKNVWRIVAQPAATWHDRGRTPDLRLAKAPASRQSDKGVGEYMSRHKWRQTFRSEKKPRPLPSKVAVGNSRRYRGTSPRSRALLQVEPSAEGERSLLEPLRTKHAVYTAWTPTPRRVGLWGESKMRMVQRCVNQGAVSRGPKKASNQEGVQVGILMNLGERHGN